MGRVSRHQHEWDVRARDLVQPGPVSVGRVSRRRHALDVLSGAVLQSNPLWRFLGELARKQRANVSVFSWIDIIDSVHYKCTGHDPHN